MTEQLDDRLIDSYASIREHFGRDAVVLMQRPEQQVFGADVVMQQSVGFFERVLEHTLAGIAELDFGGFGDFLVACKATEDLAAEVAEVVACSREDPAA